MKAKALGQDYFKLFVVPILVNQDEIKNVVQLNRAVSKIRVIGREHPLDAKRLRSGDSELIQLARLIGQFGFDDKDDHEELMLKFTEAVRNSLEPSSLKILLEDLANEWPIFNKSRRVRELFKYE